MANSKEATVEAAGSSEKKKMPLWKKIAIGIVVFIVGVIALAFLLTRGVQSAGDEFLTDLQAGQCTAIYEKTSQEFQSYTDETAWTAVCERIGPVLQGDAKSTGASTETNNGSETGQTDYRITGTDGKTYVVSFQMVKVDGEWLLNALDSSEETQ